ncbi:MAG: calcium/sodium antiporter [Planctomycetes bacterium]|nr:calcium/sodium antiporter [Planctomycetota bacterium]
MNIIWACLFLAGGLIVLWKSADLLVAGAVGLAEHFGVSPLIIGLTVVAMGTSAPEVAASIAAALRGAGDIAVGNVYGSNIANLALVGGVAALIRPLRINKLTLRREIPAMLIVSLMLWPVLRDQSLSRPEGIGLLAVFAALILLTVYAARKDTKRLATESTGINEKMDPSLRANDMKKKVLFVIIGLAGLALGAELTVRGAVYIGKQVGLSDAVIGLTIIAIGTSLPELATCIVASIKAQHDISIGNLVGSNIFNTLLVTGTAGTIRPFEIVERLAAGRDYWIMVVIGAAFTALAVISRGVINRIAGSVLLFTYIIYLFCLFFFS